MDLDRKLRDSSEVYEAQAHVYRHIATMGNALCLRCALELGIPDIIDSHDKPITLQELVSKLNLPVEKTLHLKRLMRLLIHSNFFNVTTFHDQDNKNEMEGYVLTVSSKLLLTNARNKSPNLPSLLPFTNLMLDVEYMTPLNFLGSWFKGNESTAFETAFGTSIWEFANKNPRISKLFNDAMESNCNMMKFVVEDNKEIFEGVNSLVDVGGGTGLVAKILLDAFPHMNCFVFDLPNVVADMKDSTNLKYVGGDMFSSIPYADAVILKNVLHDWGDEEALKILKRCKEAISFKHNNDQKKGKVIIMDIVISDNHNRERYEILETKLVFDVMMMVYATGKERTEDEWEKLFLQAGFRRSKITNINGLISIIEIFP